MGPKTQTIRTLQYLQPIQKTQKQLNIQADPIVKVKKAPKPLIIPQEEYEYTDDEYEEYIEEPEIIIKPIKQKPKRILTDEQKQILTSRLEQGRNKRNQETQQVKLMEQQYLQQKSKEIERELETKLIKKYKRLEKKKEKELMNKFLSEQIESNADDEYEEEIQVKPTRIIKQHKINNNGGSSNPPMQPAYKKNNYC